MESWKYIIGYEGLYMVSNMGSVHSEISNKFLKKSIDKDGYCIVGLTKNGVQKLHKVHRLVADNFLLNKENKPQVNHIDGNKTNNVKSNLEWVNNSENSKHNFKIGLSNRVGIKNNYAKLNESTVLEIRNKKGNKFLKEIANEYNVTISCIASVLARRTWKHI
jgi:hypothetical protein